MINGEWLRFDTGASLYAALREDERSHFTDAELDNYDHLFCGSNMHVVSKSMPDRVRNRMEEVDAIARTTGMLPRGTRFRQMGDARAMEA